MSFEEREQKVLQNLSGKLIKVEEIATVVRLELEKEGIPHVNPQKILYLALSLGKLHPAPGDKFRFD